MRRFTITYTGLKGVPRVIEGCVFSGGYTSYRRTDGREGGDTEYTGSDALLIIDCVRSAQMEPYPELEWLDDA